MQDFVVSVAQILGRPGEYRDVRISKPLSGVEIALARLQERPVEAELRMESVVEGILVTGTVGAPATLRCARCLEDFPADPSVQVCELFAAPGHEASVEEETYRVAGTQIDLEPMLRDAVALALPLNPLCREDCKGLCPTCGANLNDGTCDCTHEETDPRWAPLADLADKLANQS